MLESCSLSLQRTLQGFTFNCRLTCSSCIAMGIAVTGIDKKLSYRRGTARCVVSVSQDHVTHFWILHPPWNISGMAKARDFKICILVGRVKYQICDAWLSRRWTGSWSRDPFLHFWAQAISLEQIKLGISNLVSRLNVKNTDIRHVKVLQYVVYLRSQFLPRDAKHLRY